MNWRNSNSQYGWLPMGLHWLMLVLIAAVYAAMELEDLAQEGSATHAAMETWHYMLGLSVLVLAALRLAVYFMGPAPSITPSPSRWQDLGSGLMKVALYIFMLAMPLVGWALLSAEGEPIPFFGTSLPPLLSASESLAEWLEEIHEAGATLGYVLIGLHAAAALFHHYLLRDDTLRRMLPRRR